jgi:hypothetical protein
MGEAGDQTSGALTRRNAIKAAAAVGVGAAAWTGPNIGVFGAAPAYAGTCSPGEEACTNAAQVSMQPNCGGNGLDTNYSYSNLFGPGNNSLTLEGQTYTISAGTGTCTDSNSTVIVSGPTSATCRLTLFFVLQGGPNAGNQGSVVATGQGTIPVPLLSRRIVGQQGSGSLFISAQLCCTTDPDDCDNIPG